MSHRSDSRVIARSRSARIEARTMPTDLPDRSVTSLRHEDPATPEQSLESLSSIGPTTAEPGQLSFIASNPSEQEVSKPSDELIVRPT
jgi:hypothetical protein